MARCKMSTLVAVGLVSAWAFGASPKPPAKPGPKNAWVRRLLHIHERPTRPTAPEKTPRKILARLYRGDVLYVLEGPPGPVKVRTAKGIVGYPHAFDDEHITWTDITAEVARMREEIHAALKALPEPKAFRTIRKWGLKTDNYPLVRKWVVEALEAAQRAKDSERIRHLKRALRSIDLE